MADLRPRLRCPVCVGTRMERVSVGDALVVELDHCTRCGGVWFGQGEIRALGRHQASALWARISRKPHVPSMPCRGCTGTLARGDAECGACGWENRLDCAVCERPMRREHRHGVDVDVCRGCRCAWFDQPSLDAIWREQARLNGARAAVPASGVQSSSSRGSLDVPVDFDAIHLAAELTAHGVEASMRAASAAAEAATHLPDAAAGAFEAAGGALELLGAVAEGVFSVVAAILEGLCGLLGG